MKKRVFEVLLISITIWMVATSKYAVAQDESFFKGKSIRIVCSVGPGGIFDFIARATARVWPKYIPGKPTIIVQNMPGGGGNIAANYVYNIAKPDGLTLLMPLTGMPINFVLGTEGVRYDPTKMGWIGSISRPVDILIVRSDRPYSTLSDLIKAKGPIHMGAMPGTTVFSNTMSVKKVLGLPIQIVRYRSGAEADAALERGEIDGRMAKIDGLLINRDWIERKFVNFFVQVIEQRHPAFPQVPTLYEVAPAQKALIDLADSPNRWFGAYATPPGVPKDRIALLRTAFRRMVQDPEFERILGREVSLSPRTGEELHVEFDRLAAVGSQMRDDLREFWGVE